MGSSVNNYISGGNFKNAQIGDNRYARLVVNEEKKLEIKELIKEIMENQREYVRKIDECDELSSSEKSEAKLALLDIFTLLPEKELDKKKMEKSVDVLQKSSSIAAICSAIFDLYQLLT